MNVPKESTLTSEYNQEIGYHLDELRFHVRGAKESLEECKRSLGRYCIHLEEALSLLNQKQPVFSNQQQGQKQ